MTFNTYILHCLLIRILSPKLYTMFIGLILQMYHEYTCVTPSTRQSIRVLVILLSGSSTPNPQIVKQLYKFLGFVSLLPVSLGEEIRTYVLSSHR